MTIPVNFNICLNFCSKHTMQLPSSVKCGNLPCLALVAQWTAAQTYLGHRVRALIQHQDRLLFLTKHLLTHQLHQIRSIILLVFRDMFQLKGIKCQVIFSAVICRHFRFKLHALDVIYIVI